MQPAPIRIAHACAASCALIGMLASVPAAAQDRPRALVPGIGDSSTVRVQGLEAPGLAAVGLTGAEALDAAIWVGADPAAVLAELQRLPVRIANPSLAHLARRLLATPMPFDSDLDAAIVEARLDRQLRLGALADVKALLAQVPADEREALAGIALESAIYEHGADRLCADEALWPPGASSERLDVYCSLRAGEREQAELGVGLLYEGGAAPDEPFMTFAALALAEEKTAAAPAAVPRSALDLAMARLADGEISPAWLDGADPVFLAAIARDPATLLDIRLAAAESASLTGGITPTQLARVYALVPAAEPGAAWTPENRARLIAALERGIRLPYLEQLRTASASAFDRTVLPRLLSGSVASVDPVVELAGVADVIGRALLVSGQHERAVGWLEVLTWRTGRTEETEAAWRALVTLLAIAGAPPGELLGTPDDVAAVIERHAAGVGREALARALTIETITTDDASRPGGEVILQALGALGPESHEAEPDVVAEALGHLRASGLEAEARAIALDIALAAGL